MTGGDPLRNTKIAVRREPRQSRTKLRAARELVELAIKEQQRRDEARVPSGMRALGRCNCRKCSPRHD